MTTVGSAVTELEKQFREAGVPSPAVDAELLVRHVLDWDRPRYLTGRSEALLPSAQARIETLARRRVAREPLQLLLGSVAFRHIEVDVRPGVFIPRPETEVLAAAAIARTPRGGVVVEPCTGAGAVACSVAVEADPSRVVATDNDPAAVALAQHNAARCGALLTVLHGDLLDPVPATLQGQVDVLVANPPYLAAAELAATEPEVAEWDPASALVAGETGHEISGRLIAQAPSWLRLGGWLLLEVDAARAAEVGRRCRKSGFTDVTVERDLAGRDRVVAARIGDNTMPDG